MSDTDGPDTTLTEGVQCDPGMLKALIRYKLERAKLCLDQPRFHDDEFWQFDGEVTWAINLAHDLRDMLATPRAPEPEIIF